MALTSSFGSVDSEAGFGGDEGDSEVVDEGIGLPAAAAAAAAPCFHFGEE
jgi:hypothetical protein